MASTVGTDLMTLFAEYLLWQAMLAMLAPVGFLALLALQEVSR